MAMAEGLFAAVRNPFVHEQGGDMYEQEALEQLAPSSVLVLQP